MPSPNLISSTFFFSSPSSNVTINTKQSKQYTIFCEISINDLPDPEFKIGQVAINETNFLNGSFDVVVEYQLEIRASSNDPWQQPKNLKWTKYSASMRNDARASVLRHDYSTFGKLNANGKQFRWRASVIALPKGFKSWISFLVNLAAAPVQPTVFELVQLAAIQNGFNITSNISTLNVQHRIPLFDTSTFSAITNTAHREKAIEAANALDFYIKLPDEVIDYLVQQDSSFNGITLDGIIDSSYSTIASAAPKKYVTYTKSPEPNQIGERLLNVAASFDIYTNFDSASSVNLWNIYGSSTSPRAQTMFWVRVLIQSLGFGVFLYLSEKQHLANSKESNTAFYNSIKYGSLPNKRNTNQALEINNSGSVKLNQFFVDNYECGIDYFYGTATCYLDNNNFSNTINAYQQLTGRNYNEIPVAPLGIDYLRDLNIDMIQKGWSSNVTMSSVGNAVHPYIYNDVMCDSGHPMIYDTAVFMTDLTLARLLDIGYNKVEVEEQPDTVPTISIYNPRAEYGYGCSNYLKNSTDLNLQGPFPIVKNRPLDGSYGPACRTHSSLNSYSCVRTCSNICSDFR